MPGFSIGTQLEASRADDWDRLARNSETIERHLRPPLPNCRVFNSANIAITHNTLTVVTFNSERWDVGDMHSTSASTGRLVAPITGLYAVGANVRWAPNATGQRSVRIHANGVEVAMQTSMTLTDGNDALQNVNTMYRLTKGQYFEIAVYQNSGGNLNLVAATAYGIEAWAYRIGGYTNEGVA